MKRLILEKLTADGQLNKLLTNISNEKLIVIDLKNLNFIVSSTIALLVKIHKICEKEDKSLSIINAGAVYRLFETVRLTEVLNISE